MPINPKDRELIKRLRIGVDGKQLITASRFVDIFRDGKSVPLDIVSEFLSEAVLSSDSDEVELAVLVGFNLGFSEAHIKSLEALAYADWHHSHEDVASALSKVNSIHCVNALHHLATWIPEYLSYDEYRALGSKAVWALSGIAGESAKHALSEISKSQKDLIGELAEEKLAEL